ncbi:unnamed protein product (macronuclear) [Paramecium tetraurelia]|uniref:Palmitoyltransferase n=1 Tax=Paramecium tetraurelia TaxID=5888 RepID=A0BW25_PARTE|nr:uncharacterized protein GSPATT00032594001 [Paramecium tetraurelia]CAK62742.1 unnamed protein product [Paramecium tetraurelia]|eukprot:XP_001430140.1 hypothetical protein (macronuclear) [Paramecium tetraurelia strain d4-2]
MLNQVDLSQTQKEETNKILEIQNDQSFQPHYGKNYMFRFYNGQPQITIGPHWPLSVCTFILIIVGAYFISAIIHIKSGIWYSSGSVISSLILEICFLRVFLKNPGINFTSTYVHKLRVSILTNSNFQNSCQPCKLEKEYGTYHCYQCDICVKGYDHHCPWVGKCIGVGNIKEFQMFLMSLLFFFSCNLFLIMI